MNQFPQLAGRSSFLFWRMGGLIALLATEVVGTSLRYDAGKVQADRPWHALAVHAGAAARVGLAIGLFTLLVASPRWYKELRGSWAQLKQLPVFSPAIIANLAAFFCFFCISVPVLEGYAAPYASSWALFAAWVVSGAATLIFWALALLPLDLWKSLVRQSAGSLVVGPTLGIAAAALGFLAQDQWKLLSIATLWSVHVLLRLAFADTVFQPDQAIVGTRSFEVSIAPVCSGYEGVGVMAAFLAVSLWVFRHDLRFPRALALLPLGIALVWIANAVRILLLIVVGTIGYPNLALGGFHSIAGWAFFLIIGLGILFIARRMPYFSALEPQAQSPPQTLDRAYLLPVMAIVATAMATTAFSPGFDRYYPAKVIAAGLVLFIYRKCYSELRLTWSWHAVAGGCAVFALWMLMEPPDPDLSRQATVYSGVRSLSDAGAATWLLFKVVGSIVTVPLAEELAFRGYLTRRLIGSDFQTVPPGQLTWFSFVVSSALFGALHGRWVAGTLAGMAYAIVYHRRGQLTDAIVAHGVTNALIAVVVLATGMWSLWG